MNPTLYNPTTGITAVPNANTTSAQQSAAQNQGFIPINLNGVSTKIGTNIIGTQPLVIPPKPITTTISNPVPPPTGTTVDANGSAVINPPATDTTAPEKSLRQKMTDLFQTDITALGTKGAETAKLQNDLQLQQKTEQATRDYNAYNQAKLDLQNRVLELKQQAGGTVGGNQQAIDDLTYKGNANLANLAIQAQASQGLLSAAQQTIKDKLDTQFQPITDQIDYITKFAQYNANDLTDSEKYQLDQVTQQKKTDLANITKTADDLHQSLLQNGAPQTVYSALDKITQDYTAGNITASDAQSKMYQAAGQYGVDAMKAAQLAQTKANTAKLNAEAKLASGDGGQSLTVDYTGFMNTLSPDKVAAFNAIPEGNKSSVAQLVNGDTLLADLVKSRGIQGTEAIKQLINQAMSVDPTFSVNTNKVRYAANLAWNNPNGKAFLTRSAMNTAMSHMATTYESALALGNTDLPKYNDIKNWLSKNTGNPALTNFVYDVTALSGELASAYKNGTAPSEMDTQRFYDALSSGMSSAQFSGGFTESANLMAGKLRSLAQEYKQTAGKYPSDPIIQPSVLTDLKNAGIDVTAIDGILKAQGYDVGTSTPSSTAITAGTEADMNGVTYTYNGSGDTSDIKNWTKK